VVISPGILKKNENILEFLQQARDRNVLEILEFHDENTAFNS